MLMKTLKGGGGLLMLNGLKEISQIRLHVIMYNIYWVELT